MSCLLNHAACLQPHHGQQATSKNYRTAFLTAPFHPPLVSSTLLSNHVYPPEVYHFRFLCLQQPGDNLRIIALRAQHFQARLLSFIYINLAQVQETYQ